MFSVKIEITKQELNGNVDSGGFAIIAGGVVAAKRSHEISIKDADEHKK